MLFKAKPPPTFGQNGQKWQKRTFWFKWAQICIKLMKILNLAQKVGSTGKKMTIKSRKAVSADTLFHIILGFFGPFLKKIEPQPWFSLMKYLSWITI